MIDRRARRAIAIGCIAAAGTAGVALAQAPATPAGNFGGGAIAVPVDENTIAEGHAAGDPRGGRAGASASTASSPRPCGHATIRGKTTLAADGQLHAARHRDPQAGGRRHRAHGVHRDGHADRRRRHGHGEGDGPRACRQAGARRAPARAARSPGRCAGPARSRRPRRHRREATLFGLTAQSGASAKRPIVLHVTKAGRAIDRLVLGFRAPCEQPPHRRAPTTSTTRPSSTSTRTGRFAPSSASGCNFSDVTQRTTDRRAAGSSMPPAPSRGSCRSPSATRTAATAGASTTARPGPRRGPRGPEPLTRRPRC